MNRYSVFESIVGRKGWGHRPALLGEKRFSYGELLQKTEELSKKLQGLLKNERALVAVCLPVCTEYIISLIAIYQLGGIIVPINPNAPANEKEHVLSDSGADLVISNNKNLTASMQSTEVSKTETWEDIQIVCINSQRKIEPEKSDRIIIYTSGSTGKPKGSVLTDYSLSSNIIAVANYLALSPSDKTMVFTPPAFAYAISQILTHLWVGGSIFPWRHGLTFPDKILKGISDEKLTGIAANPGTLRLITSSKKSTTLALEQVRYVMSGGQPLYTDMVRKIYETFPCSRVVSMYGCTENAPRISYYWLPVEVEERNSPYPIGYPVEGTKIKILDDDGCKPENGTAGHISIQGSSLMRAYWGDNSLTESKFTDGWFNTGDLGYYDEKGTLNLVGRSDNIISVGHVKVSPEEVESVIGKVEGVVEVAVGGIPDELLDSVPVALLAIEKGRDKEQLTQRVMSICRESLYSSKVPRRFFFVEDIPRTLYGKIDRKNVKNLIAKQVSLS